MPEHPHVTLLGYDVLNANVECVKNGSVDFLIAQHPQSQGLNCFRSMFNSCVLKMALPRDHYMAIELLTKENIERMHSMNIEANCWTCDDPEYAEKLVNWEIDYITSNILE